MKSPRFQKTNGVSSGQNPKADQSARHRGVLLINLGTPNSPEVPDVRSYLAEFLSDPEVIRLPWALSWFNGPLGRLIARFRAPKSAEMYRKVWTDRGSPLLAITQDQASHLERLLPKGWRVFHAMRYGSPSIAETVRSIESAGIDELVVIPMYPQFSGPTTGTALRELYSYLRRSECSISVTTRAIWYDDGAYVNAQAKRIFDFAAEEQLTPENTHLLFSAHGLPVSYAERGDPYPRHVQRSVNLVMQRLGWPAERSSVAYQSRFGPATWLEPAADAVLAGLCDRGEKRILVCPISFTVDCLETLEELDIRYRAIVEEKGGQLHVCPALNTYGPFVAALKELALHGASPITSWGDEVSPLMTREVADADAAIDSLVLIGTSLAPRLASRMGSGFQHADAQGMRRVKRSQCEVPGLLRDVQEATGVGESWLWNTCNRFEFCGWASDPSDSVGRDGEVAKLRAQLFGSASSESAPVNVLYGSEALHHLMRTAAGLNSKLPGERDIADQLSAAQRLAKSAGTAGARASSLLKGLQASVGELREETKWGEYAPDYCGVALSGVASDAQIDFSTARIVVVGGSTTSAGVLRAMMSQFGVPDQHLTLIYRGHSQGGQMKMLRKAIGHGRRVRIQSYDEPQVARIIGEADVVVFGLDRQDPVLTAQQLDGIRDFAERPLAVVDFNMFGSTSGLDEVAGVDLFAAGKLESLVDAYAEELCSTDEFKSAVEEAEEWIERRVRRDESADSDAHAARRVSAMPVSLKREYAS